MFMQLLQLNICFKEYHQGYPHPMHMCAYPGKLWEWINDIPKV